MGGQLNLEDLSSFAGALERFERAPGPPSVADPELAKRLGDSIANDPALAELFYRWAIVTGIAAPDPGVLEQSRAFYLALDQAEAQQAGQGSPGRVQFASERALQEEQTASLRQGRQVELASFMENLKEMAFGRVRDKMELLQDVDKIRDARHAAAISALMDAAPFILPEGLENFPGFEPGGIGDVLGGRLGVNVPNLQIPRVRLPLQEFVDAPLQASPEAIRQQLDPLTGTVQQPRQVQLPVG